MNQPSRKKLILSWILEGVFLLIQIITIILFIPLPNNKKGEKNTIVIITDVLTSPILYLIFYLYLVKNHYKVYLFYSFNPFKNINSHSKKLSKYLLKIPENNLTLIGHGSGGLIPLSISDEARKKVKKFVTLGTTFWGTQVFSWIDFIPFFKDLLPRSEYLITYRMNSLLYEEFYPFIPWIDEWVIPNTLQKFGQGRDIILDIPGRLNLILHLENIKTYIQFFDQIHNYNQTKKNVKNTGDREQKISKSAKKVSKKS